MKSWQTKLTGIATVVVAVGNALIAQFDGNLATNPDWGVVIASITAGIGLFSARQNNVTSEQAGAK